MTGFDPIEYKQLNLYLTNAIKLLDLYLFSYLLHNPQFKLSEEAFRKHYGKIKEKKN